MQVTLRSIREASLRGTRVLLRTSLNVPLAADGSVGDTYRLEKDLPTLRYLAEQGAKVVLIGYIGREGGSLQPVAEALAKLAPELSIRFTAVPPAEAAPEVAALREGECLMLENLRRDPREEPNDETLAAELAQLAEVFVGDAFAEAHRAYASNVGVAKRLPSYAGLLMEEEVTRLAEALEPPQGALAIIGGAKFETKEPLIEKILSVYPRLLLGGALANDLLKARGLPIGDSLTSGVPVPVDIAGDERVLLPDDLVVEGASGARPAHSADVRIGEHIVDVGEATARAWAALIEQASFVLWNGPMGVYEKGYVAGTDLLAEALGRSQARAVLGGGDTDAAISKIPLDRSRIFISTGGGAMLDFLATGGVLPGIEVLQVQ